MATDNVSPVIGVGVSFNRLQAGQNSDKFVCEPGIWAVSLEFHESTQNLGNDRVTLVQISAGNGNAANTTVLTMNKNGYYNFVVGAGPLITYQFQTVNGCRNVRAALVSNKIGPS